MNKIAILSMLVILPPRLMVRADNPEAERPWVATSKGGDFFFKMVPAKWKEEANIRVLERESFGVAYSISGDGEFKEVWRTSGWYAFEGFLSGDGRYLVRFGLWASDQKNHTDPAIAFYDRGKLLREYQVKDLIQKPDLLEDSASHYMWRPAMQTRANGFYPDAFHLVMIDKTSYSFDYKTGEIVSRERDEGAKSDNEIFAEQKLAAGHKGRALFEASILKEDFQQCFEISKVSASRSGPFECSLEGMVWSADLVPKQKLKHAAKVDVVFPVSDDGRITASINSSGILGAMETAFEHPFVANLFSNGDATGIRMRIQGDRLHWNTLELVGFLEKITGAKPGGGDLGHWAYIIIDGKPHEHTPIYLNTKTREMIIEDESKLPYEPYLIDASGRRAKENKEAPSCK